MTIFIAHPVFTGMDILATMILVKVVYDRWRPDCLRPISNAIEPVMSFITGHLETVVTRITGRTYTDKELLILLIVCLSFVRLVLCGLV